MSVTRIAAAMVVLLLATSCERDGRRGTASGPSADQARLHIRSGRPAASSHVVEAGLPAPESAAAAATVDPADGMGMEDQKLILTARYRVEVDLLDSALVRLKREILFSGGFVSREERRRGDHDILTAMIVCRIPASRSREFVTGIAGLGTVENAEESVDDITERTIDLEARLANQKKLEASLQGLLLRKGSGLTDLLSLERELARVRSEIEGLEGRKRYWDRRVAYATATVEIHEPLPVIATASGGVGREFAASFRKAGENLVATTAGIIAVAGAFIPIGLLGIVLFASLRSAWRRARRIRRVKTA